MHTEHEIDRAEDELAAYARFQAVIERARKEFEAQTLWNGDGKYTVEELVNETLDDCYHVDLKRAKKIANSAREPRPLSERCYETSRGIV